VKYGRPPEFLDRAAGLVRDHVTGGGFADFFGPDVALVPTPGSAPLAPGATLSAGRIVDALSRAGVAGSILPILTRHTAVQKSAFARPGERPTARTHVESFRVERIGGDSSGLFDPRRILIVDDFVTKGATLYAAATVVADAFPRSEVRAFALVRTMGRVPEVSALMDPCEGRLTYQFGAIDRQP
jgi:hypothetical protein